MAQAQDLRQAITSVADRQGPILSAYLSVNADIPENQGRTYLVRLRDAMNDEGVPKDLQQRIRAYLEKEAHPAARTLAIFVDEDDLFEVYRLQVDVPESFRWGDPFVAPLTLESGRVRAVRGRGPRRREVQVLRGLALEQRARGRGEKDQRFQGGRPPSQRALPQGRGFDGPRPGGPQTRVQHPQLLQGARRTDPRYHLPGGGEAPHTRRSQREDGRVPSPRSPTSFKERVVAEEHVDIGESEGELLDDLEAIRERAEHEREKALLDEIRERGVRGPDETIAALQEENRIYHLAALWEMEAEIRWCDNDQLAIRDATAEECPFCGQNTRGRPLTGRPRRPRRRPRRPPRLHARREREHGRSARRVRRDSGADAVLGSFTNVPYSGANLTGG